MPARRHRDGSGRSASGSADGGRRKNRRKLINGNHSTFVREGGVRLAQSQVTRHPGSSTPNIARQSLSPPTVRATSSANLERPFPFSLQENTIYDATLVAAPRDFDLALKLERFACKAWTVACQSVRRMPHESETQIKILVHAFRQEWVRDFAVRAFQSAYSQGWNSDRLNPDILSALLQEACGKLDIFGSGAPWKMRVSDGLIHHAVQSTWAEIMAAPNPRPPKGHLSPARSEEREEPKGGRLSLKSGVVGSSRSAENMQAAETRITELRAKLLEQQAQQSAVDRHRHFSYSERNANVKLGTKGKAPPALRDRRWHSDAADDMSVREDSEAQAAAAADAMVASLRQEMRLASDVVDSAGYRTESCPIFDVFDSAKHQIESCQAGQEQLESPESPPDEPEPIEEQPALNKAPQRAQERQASSITIHPKKGESSLAHEERECSPALDHCEEENSYPAPAFPETIDHDDERPETFADESEPAEEESNSDMLSVPSVPSVAEEASSPAHLAAIVTLPSKRSFARPLRRMSSTTTTATSVPHCPPVAGAAKDDEDSDEWPEEQLGDRLRTCFDGPGSGTGHYIDLN